MKRSHERRSIGRCWSLEFRSREDKRCLRSWRLKIEMTAWVMKRDRMKWLIPNEQMAKNRFVLGFEMIGEEQWKWWSSDKNVSGWDCPIDFEWRKWKWLLWWLLIVWKVSLIVRTDPVLSDLRTEWLVDGSKWMWQDKELLNPFCRLSFCSHCF